MNVAHIMLTLAAGHFVTVMSPGPNQALVLATAARHRADGLFVAAGAWPAGAFWAAMGLAGMGEVIRSAPWLELGVRIVCGVFLLYLGARMFLNSMRSRAGAIVDPPRRSRLQYAFLGFLSNVGNAKAIAYYASIFTAVGAYALPWRWQMVAIFGMPAIGFACNAFLALAISSPPAKRIYAKISHWIDRVSGSVLVLFGLRLLAAS